MKHILKQNLKYVYIMVYAFYIWCIDINVYLCNI